jgi:hypothetical protein
MNDPRAMAERLLGRIDWENEVSGFCHCPGEAMHTHRTGKKDCRVNIDGAPTVFCFHASCIAAVSEANARLRRDLGASPWELRLPSGQVLRSGELMRSDGTVSRRAPSTINHQLSTASERTLLQSLRMHASRFRPELFQFFQWPFAQILEDSPLLVAERDPEDQFRTWLKLWPACSTVWIGDVFSSGRPEHRTHFRPVADWYQIGPVMGNYTCGSSFKPGSYRRSNENLDGHRFMVVESDTLGHDEIGAVFAFLQRRLHYEMHCIIDTAGKSLHGWFQSPPNKILENRLKAGLEEFGCDPKVFTYSQPVRVPGAWRDGKLQRLIWLRD